MIHDAIQPLEGDPVSALIVDDHPLFSFAVATTVERMFPGGTVKSATSMRGAVDHVSNGFEPDIVLLDLRLPDATGLSGFLLMREKLPETPILVISAVVSPDIVRSLMGAGAAGYLQKDTSAQALHQVLLEIRAGRKYVPTGYQSICDDAGAESTGEATHKIVELTPQQTKIMKLICEGKPNKQIAYELSLAEATVKAHVTALLRRLGVKNRTQAAIMMESVDFEVPTARCVVEASRIATKR